MGLQVLPHCEIVIAHLLSFRLLSCVGQREKFLHTHFGRCPRVYCQMQVREK